MNTKRASFATLYALRVEIPARFDAVNNFFLPVASIPFSSPSSILHIRNNPVNRKSTCSLLFLSLSLSLALSLPLYQRAREHFDISTRVNRASLSEGCRRQYRLCIPIFTARYSSGRLCNSAFARARSLYPAVS